MPMDINNVGQGKTHPEAVDAYDAGYGKYQGNVPRTGNQEGLLPTDAMPKAPDPSPFTVGPMAPGGR